MTTLGWSSHSARQLRRPFAHKLKISETKRIRARLARLKTSSSRSMNRKCYATGTCSRSPTDNWPSRPNESGDACGSPPPSRLPASLGFSCETTLHGSVHFYTRSIAILDRPWLRCNLEPHIWEDEIALGARQQSPGPYPQSSARLDESPGKQ